jgi:hypothetical protein
MTTIEEMERELAALRAAQPSPQPSQQPQPQQAHGYKSVYDIPMEEYLDLTKYPITEKEREAHRKQCIEYANAKIRLDFQDPNQPVEDFVRFRRTCRELLCDINEPRLK